MLSLNRKKIERATDKLKASVTDNMTKSLGIKKEKDKLDVEEKRLRLVISHQEFQLRILRDALLVSRGVPADVAELRQRLLNMMLESKRKDILISRKEQLEALDIPRLQKELQKLCKHLFIVGRVSYESYDHYEKSWVIGFRMCVVCELGETASGSAVHSDGPWSEVVDKFPTLNENPDRVIDKHGLGAEDVRNIWRPLEEVLAHFVDKRVYEIL